MSSDEVKKSVADAGDHARETAATAKGTASGYASKAGEQVNSMAEQATDSASDLYGQARSKLHDMADAMPGSASEAMTQGRKAYETGSAQVVEQVKKQPLEALLLAISIGYLVGWATTR